MENKRSDDFKKKDLRVQKTYLALYEAIFLMLGRRNFKEITVNDLCAEALISRAAFYAHFNDKYDLLKYFLTNVKKNIIKDIYNYEELEREVNQFINLNKKVIINILQYANNETSNIIREFISSIIELAIKREVISETDPHYIIIINFVTGGLINLFTWMVENNFPPEIKMMNTYLYKMLQNIMAWDEQQEQIGVDTKD